MKEEKNNDIIHTLIARSLSDEATPQEIQQLKEWLESDEENLRYFNQLNTIWQAANPVFNPDEIDTEKAYRNVTGKLKPAGIKPRKFIGWFSRVAAVLFIPLLVATVYQLLKPLPQAEVVYQEIHAPYGTFAQTVLPDGSKVSLNAGSTLKFPTQFAKAQRDVYLDGEGYFEVAASKTHPFRVHTRQFTVEATGTKFNVEDYSTDTVAAVTMIEGVVNANLPGRETLPLKPGSRIVLAKTSGRLQQIDTDPYKWYAWKDGRLIFRNDPLEYVFKRLNQTFNVNIIIKDRELAAQKYRATFTNESLEEIMRMLLISAPIRFEETERSATNGEYQSKRTIEVYYAQQ